MCHLSQEEIKENTLAEVIMTMYDNHFTLEQIAIATKKSVEEIKVIIAKNETIWT